MADLFVTGITGVVGKAVETELRARGRSAVLLQRTTSSEPDDSFERVEGDLETPASWIDRLEGVRSVLHMAALTGVASKDEFERVNVEGTRSLVEACERAGVRRFVFVSSIAAAFDDLDDYPYGASKRDAERVVRESSLDWTIVRPTVVIGPDSPILLRFRQLASMPISMLPGSGEARIQPVAAEDLAAALLELADGDDAVRETIEVGGREIVTLADFLGEVRTALGRGAGGVVRLPLGPIRLGLRAAAALTGGRFPVSPAQLAMFEQDGVAEPHEFTRARRESLLDTAGMLRRALAV